MEGQFVIFIADDIYLMGGSENGLQDLTTILKEKARAYGMEVSSEKSKVLVNSTNQSIPINIMMNSQNLEEVDFQISCVHLKQNSTSTKEIKIRIAVAWKSRDISFQTKLKLYRALAVSTLLYGCES